MIGGTFDGVPMNTTHDCRGYPNLRAKAASIHSRAGHALKTKAPWPRDEGTDHTVVDVVQRGAQVATHREQHVAPKEVRYDQLHQRSG